MTGEDATCRQRTRRALVRWADEKDADFIRAVQRILEINCQQGRVRKFLESGTADTYEDYVARVAHAYEEQHHYVHLVQEVQDHEIWLELYEQMQKWAYAILTKREFLHPQARFQHGIDCAAEAAVTVLKRHFPFDVAFGAWVHQIVYYTCLYHIRKEGRAYPAPQEKMVPLDKWEGWLENMVDPNAGEEPEQFALRDLLLQAIEKLSDSQQEFVLLHYFKGRTFAEIADLTGRSLNAVYQLHHKALKELRKILSDYGNIYE